MEENKYGDFINQCKQGVAYGIVDEHYVDTICLQLIEPKDTRLINGVPILEIPKIGEWNPLPKGYKFGTSQLINETQSEILDLNIDIKNPQAILDAYHSGILVNVQDQQSLAMIEVRDSNHYNRKCGKLGVSAPANHYQIVKKFLKHHYRLSHITRPFFDVYATYDEAKKVANAINAENERKANLSPYDYSVEEIDKTLDIFCGYKCYDSDLKAAIRKRLLSLDNVEDLYIRICGNELQYRYEKNKKWKNISKLFDK